MDVVFIRGRARSMIPNYRSSKLSFYGPNWLDNAVFNFSGLRLVAQSGSLCVNCRGGRMLCGKTYCPIISKAASLVKNLKRLDSNRLEGASPPGIFVGRMGYPKVYVGPMIPPFHGDTSILDKPEEWMSKSFEEIIGYRYSLIRGKQLVKVYEASDPNRFLLNLQELAMSEQPVDSEALFKKKPSNVMILNEYSQPFGPSALLRDYRVDSIKVDHKVEKLFYDGDLPATQAIMSLYEDEVSITRIQRCLTAGILGEKSRRRLVPTRWAITAVDDTVSKTLLRSKKINPVINECRVYSLNHLGNVFAALLYPSNWEYEWIEAWFPGTTWNTNGSTAELIGDFEGFEGRTKYAQEIGGCYYAARLAVAEALSRERCQAGVLVLREISPSYILPVGVWNVRESVRSLLRTPYEEFENLEEAVKALMEKLTIPYGTWLSKSRLLQNMRFQRKLEHFTISG